MKVWISLRVFIRYADFSISISTESLWTRMYPTKLMNVKVLNVGFKFQLSINVVYLNYILVEIKVSKILEKNIWKVIQRFQLNYTTRISLSYQFLGSADKVLQCFHLQICCRGMRISWRVVGTHTGHAPGDQSQVRDWEVPAWYLARAGPGVPPDTQAPEQVVRGAAWQTSEWADLPAPPHSPPVWRSGTRAGWGEPWLEGGSHVGSGHRENWRPCSQK